MDDDPSIHEAFLVMFEEEYEVLRALSGQEALEILKSRHVDLILLDHWMPEMSGIDFLRLARRLGPLPRVIMVTVYNAADPAVAAMRLGVAEYVTKPFDPDALELLVRRTLEQPPRQPSDIDVARDSVHRVLLVGGAVGTRAALAVALRTRCVVAVVPTPPAALGALTRMLPDLVIVDTASAGSDGMDRVRSLRAYFPIGPVIVVSSDERPPTLIDVLAAGAAPTLMFTRPLNFDRLLREIVALLSARPDLAALSRFTPMVSRVIEYVAVHYAKATVQDLAAAVRLSSSHFSRTFREGMRMTPKKYLTRVRIEAAGYRRKETQLKAKAIARLVGLYDSFHMARVARALRADLFGSSGEA